MNIEKYLKEKKEDFKRLKALSQARQDHAEKLLATIRDWLYDSPFTQYMLLNKDKKVSIFGISQTELSLNGLACNIWMRRVLDESKILLLIGNTQLEYRDENWCLDDDNCSNKLTKELFFKILIHEIDNKHPAYF